MKNKTPFRIAAERFADRTNKSFGCCQELDNHDEYGSASDYFNRMFRPTDKEGVEYQVYWWYWMESNKQSSQQNRNDRILALLFCEQLWLDEHKSKTK